MRNLILSILLLLQSFTVNPGQNNAVEIANKLRLVVDGTVKVQAISVIEEDNTYYLPVKGVIPNLNLTKSAVKIIEKDNSCIASYGTNKVEFKAGEKSIYVNNKQTSISKDVKNSNGELYVPLDFVTAFKKVAYIDKDTNSILVTDKDNYEKVKKAIETMNKNLNKIKNYKVQLNNYEYCMFNDGKDLQQQNSSYEIDNIHNIMHGIEKSSGSSGEVYYTKGIMYFQDNKKWFKAEADKPFMNGYRSISQLYYKKPSFYAGLKYSVNAKLKEIKLSGFEINDMVGESLFLIASGPVSGVGFTQCSYELILDQATYNMKSLKCQVKGNNKPGASYSYKFEKRIDLKIKDINKTSVKAPKGIEKAEVMEG